MNQSPEQPAVTETPEFPTEVKIQQDTLNESKPQQKQPSRFLKHIKKILLVMAVLILSLFLLWKYWPFGAKQNESKKNQQSSEQQESLLKQQQDPPEIQEKRGKVLSEKINKLFSEKQSFQNKQDTVQSESDSESEADLEDNVEQPSAFQKVTPAIVLEEQITEKENESESSKSSQEEDIIDNILNQKKTD